MAVLAFKTFAMPRSSFGEDLFGGEYYTTTTGTTLAWRSLDRGGVDNRGLRSLVADRGQIALKSATTLAITISFGAEILSVTHFAVYIPVGAFSDVDRVESFVTRGTLETRLVERSSSG